VPLVAPGGAVAGVASRARVGWGLARAAVVVDGVVGVGRFRVEVEVEFFVFIFL
jgi:hypothetical protein